MGVAQSGSFGILLRMCTSTGKGTLSSGNNSYKNNVGQSSSGHLCHLIEIIYLGVKSPQEKSKPRVGDIILTLYALIDPNTPEVIAVIE